MSTVSATRGRSRIGATFADPGTVQTVTRTPSHQNATGTTRGSPSRPV
jgi:hypothetical protein